MGKKWKELTMARKHSELSVQDLAVKVGVAVNTVYRWENGPMRPHHIIMEKLVQILGFESELKGHFENNRRRKSGPKKRRGA